MANQTFPIRIIFAPDIEPYAGKSQLPLGPVKCRITDVGILKAKEAGKKDWLNFAVLPLEGEAQGQECFGPMLPYPPPAQATDDDSKKDHRSWVTALMSCKPGADFRGKDINLTDARAAFINKECFLNVAASGKDPKEGQKEAFHNVNFILKEKYDSLKAAPVAQPQQPAGAVATGTQQPATPAAPPVKSAPVPQPANGAADALGF